MWKIFFVILHHLTVMTDSFNRYGFITGVSAEGFLSVRPITEGDNCSCCSVASFCGKGDEIVVPYPEANRELIGRKVMLIFDARELPSWLRMLMPVLLLVGVAVGLLACGVPDIWCVASAISAMILWYVALHLYNNRELRVRKVEFIEHFPEGSCYSNDMEKGN